MILLLKFRRKSITGHWKANTGSAMLEQIPMTDRYKFWIDEVSKIFGGLHICEIQAVVHAETQKEYIIDVVDSAFTLLGEQQDGDRRPPHKGKKIISAQVRYFYSYCQNLSSSIPPTNLFLYHQNVFKQYCFKQDKLTEYY